MLLLLLLTWLQLSAGQYPILSGNGGCTWQHIACVTDNADRLLKGVLPEIESADMSLEKCLAFCNSFKYKIAGVEDGRLCYCDNRFSYVAERSFQCSKGCGGNFYETCGGVWAMNVYRCAELAPGPDGLSGCTWERQGCFQDRSDKRLIPEIHFENQYMSVEQCTSYCYSAKYPYAGLEDGRHCFCGYGFLYSSPQLTTCSQVCPGNSNELCGGFWAIDVYRCVGSSSNQNRWSPTIFREKLEWSEGKRVNSVPWGDKPFPKENVLMATGEQSSVASGSVIAALDEEAGN